MDNYKQVEDKKLASRLLQIAEDSVKGAGDGRISKSDAEKILATVIDRNVYTAIEKETVAYIHKNYKWTEAAWDWFHEQIKNWEKEFEKPIRMTPEELTKQHFGMVDVLSN